MSKKPKVIDKDRFDAAMILASYYSSWSESINQGEFKKKHGVYPEQMVERYQKGQAKASQVIAPIKEAIRSDTQEGKDAAGFFDDLSTAADML